MRARFFRRMLIPLVGAFALMCTIPAIAGAYWFDNGAEITRAQEVKLTSTMFVLKDGMAEGTIQEVSCSGFSGKGWVGSKTESKFNSGEVTSWAPSSCVNLKECSEPKVEAINLPWKLEEVSGPLLNVSGHNGNAGYRVHCKVVGIPFSDECSFKGATEKLLNETFGVLWKEKIAKSTCASGKIGTYELDSAIKLELTNGGKLEAR